MPIRSIRPAMLRRPIRLQWLCRQGLRSLVDTSMQTILDINPNSTETKRVPDTDKNNTLAMSVTDAARPTMVASPHFKHVRLSFLDRFSPTHRLTDHRSDNAGGGPENSGPDPFRSYATPQTQPLNPSLYNATSRLSPPPQQPYGSAVAEPTASYYTPQVQAVTDSRSYTLGGGGYGDNVPPLHDRTSATSQGYLPYPGDAMTQSSASVYSGVGTDITTSPRGTLQPVHEGLTSPVQYEDSPPRYDDGVGIETSHVTAVAPSGKR